MLQKTDSDSKLGNILLPVLAASTRCVRLPSAAQIGTLVHVAPSPMSRSHRSSLGVVTHILADDTKEITKETALKTAQKTAISSATAVAHAPQLRPSFVQFLTSVSQWTLSARGMILRAALPPKPYFHPEPVTAVDLFSPHQRKRQRQQLIPAPAFPAQLPLPELSPAQRAAADTIRTEPCTAHPPVYCLAGVTGSGKTLVYAEAIARTLAQGRQVLVLVPEILLAKSTQIHLAQLLGAPPELWTSAMTPRQRASVWTNAALGNSAVIVGVRSAVFLPLAKPGLIIVDEEHDQSFKNAIRPSYHAREAALLRGQAEHIPCILASATPSTESRFRAQSNHYTLVPLDHRHGSGQLPQIHISRHHPRHASLIGSQLQEHVVATLKRGEQVMLFLNRRGYAPVVSCQSCQTHLLCARCAVVLTWHQQKQQLTCSQCGQSRPLDHACASCGKQQFVFVGAGVERLAQEAQTLFAPSLKAEEICIASSDFVSTAAKHQQMLSRIVSGSVRLIVATQLLSKGYNFPLLTLIGIVDAEAGTHASDFRTRERQFQLISQVGGRAGRFAKQGQVVVQIRGEITPTIESLCSQDYERFFQEEITHRQTHHWPPFTRLAGVMISADSQNSAETGAMLLAEQAQPLLPTYPHIELLGPAPAPIPKIGGQYRYRLLIRSFADATQQSYRDIRPLPVQPFLKHWLGSAAQFGHYRHPQWRHKPVSIRIDVDPIDFS